MQGAILDVELESRRYMEAFRRDVQAAKQISISPKTVQLVRHDGVKVSYALGSRQEADASGKQLGEDRFPYSKRVDFERKGRTVKVDLQIERNLGTSKLTRDYWRSASPRAPSASVESSK